MRNLKRALSLALACIMVIGMMVMGVSAADYGDYAEIEYLEAVEVLGMLGVLEGDDNGNFNPTDVLTREQAAKIIAYMMLGKDNAEKLNANNTVFKDVAAGRWSAGYISYCTTVGILAGVGDGNFDPTGELTGVAFGKMLLCALGYDAKIEGYVGADWATNIATDIIGAGIDVKGVTMANALTREQAAQMAFQTLEADVVDYNNRGWEMTLENGQTIVMGASKAVADPYTAADYNGAGAPTADPDDTTLQFCEKYFDGGKNGGLKLDNGAHDIYGRPGHEWTKGKSAVWVQDAPVVTYDGKTLAAQINSDLSGTKFTTHQVADETVKVDTYKMNDIMDLATTEKVKDLISITTLGGFTDNGDLTFGTAMTMAERLQDLTGNGKVVEIYADRGSITDIVVIEYTVGRLTGLLTAKDRTTYTVNGINQGVDYVDNNLDDTVKLHGDVRRGAVVTAIRDQDGVLHIYPTTSVVGTQTSVTTVKNLLTIDGETYKIGAGVNDGADYVKAGDFLNGYKNANYYLDQYGYVVATSGIASNEYAYIVAADAVAVSALESDAIYTVTARAVLADGTTGIYNIPVEKLKDARDGASAGDWVVKNTDTVVCAAANAGSESSFDSNELLSTNTFGYTLTDEGLILETIPTYANATATGNTVYAIATDTNIKVHDTEYAIDGSAAKLLVNDSTQFVVYDGTKKTVNVFVGPDSIPSALTNTYKGYAVMRTTGADSDVAVASVIFMTPTTTYSADDIDEYVYIEAFKYTESLVNGIKIFTYDGWTADGNTIKVTKKGTALGNANSGLYEYDANNEIVGSEQTSGRYIADTALTIDNDLVKAGGSYYQMTDETKVVYVDDTLITAHANTGSLVLDVAADGTVLNKVDVIFVTAD